MQGSEQQFLAEVLVRRGVLPPDKLEESLATSRERSQTITDVLISSNVAQECSASDRVSARQCRPCRPRSTPGTAIPCPSPARQRCSHA